MTGTKESNYHRIQTRPLSLSEKDIAHFFEASRFDPRLMEVSTEFIRDFWWNLNPKILNKFLKSTKYPYAIKPAILAIIKLSSFPSDEAHADFLKWYEKVLAGIKNPAPQLFYIGLNKIGSKSMEREVNESLPYFTHFNLLSKDIPFNKGNPGVVKTSADILNKKADQYDLIKSSLAGRIKKIKVDLNLKNADMIESLGINRLFLSKILNNNLEGISVDYLLKKIDFAEKVYRKSKS